jgi:hypothetical protein
MVGALWREDENTMMPNALLVPTTHVCPKNKEIGVEAEGKQLKRAFTVPWQQCIPV